MNAFKKVTVNLPTEQVEFLQRLAAEEKVSVVDVLRRAINSEMFFVENEKGNRKILVEDGARIREVIRK
jgi:transcriptional regulator of met regulon